MVQLSISRASSSLWCLVATAWAWWPNGLMRSFSPGPNFTVSQSLVPGKLRASHSSLSPGENTVALHPPPHPRPTAIAEHDGNAQGTFRRPSLGSVSLLLDFINYSNSYICQQVKFCCICKVKILGVNLTKHVEHVCWKLQNTGERNQRTKHGQIKLEGTQSKDRFSLNISVLNVCIRFCCHLVFLKYYTRNVLVITKSHAFSLKMEVTRSKAMSDSFPRAFGNQD